MSNPSFSHTLPSLHNLSKRRDQSLCQPEAEHQLGSGHEQLRRQALEERGETLVLGHAGNNPESRFRVLEVAVLDPGLDDIKRGRHNQRSAGTEDGSHEVLCPRRRVVILEPEDIFFSEGRTTEKLEDKVSISTSPQPKTSDVRQKIPERYAPPSNQRHDTVPFPHQR